MKKLHHFRAYLIYEPKKLLKGADARDIHRERQAECVHHDLDSRNHEVSKQLGHAPKRLIRKHTHLIFRVTPRNRRAVG